jgi:RNA-binding protein YlmH
MNLNYFSGFTLVCLLSSGDVRVNWAQTTKNGVTLKSGDVVSVSGMGRLKVIGKKQEKM